MNWEWFGFLVVLWTWLEYLETGCLGDTRFLVGLGLNEGHEEAGDDGLDDLEEEDG